MFAGELALTIAAAVTGAAVYINVAEQPARLQLDNRSLLAEWKPAYKRGYAMQANLAIVGGLFGLLAYLSALDWRWLLGAIVPLEKWPYTLFVIAPIYRRLMDTPPEAAMAETRRMLEQWGALLRRRGLALGLGMLGEEAPREVRDGRRRLRFSLGAGRVFALRQEYRRLLDHVVLPALGKKRMADITRQDVARLHHARRATPTEANRALAVISAMFNLAERWGERPDGSNPCRHVEKFSQRRRERFLSAEELGRLGDVLAGYDGSPYYSAAIKLLVFTGARLGEVLGLQWQWIDFDRGEARLPDSKTGAKTLHLPPPALAVLAELPRIEGNPYVIVGGVAGAALVNLEKPWRAIRKAAGLEDVRLHDLRHAFASVAAASGMGLPIIGKMLGHSQAQTTQRYAHLASDPVKAAAAIVAGKIAAAMAGGSVKVDEAAATVIKLRPGA